MACINQELRFSGGMDMDSSPESLPANSYRYARNIDLLGDEEESHSIVTNSDGNKLIAELPIITIGNQYDIPIGIHINGFKYVRNKIIIFTTRNNDDTESEYNDQIWVTDYDPVTETSTLTFDDLKYNGKLNLSMRNKISNIEIDYRSDDTIFVYWADGRNELRGCNVMATDLSSYTIDLFGILPNANLPAATVTSIGNSGGEFMTGVVQYTYKLTIGSASTNFAPIEKSYNIYVDAFPSNFTLDVNGSAASEKTAKSCDIEINITESLFDTIEIYRIFYSYRDIAPTIHKIYENSIDNSTITYTDNGIINLDSVSTIELAEIITPFIPNNITSAGNMLFASNIKEITFDVDYDARAYRFKVNDLGGNYSSTESKYYKNSGDTTPSLMHDGTNYITETELDIIKYDASLYNRRYQKTPIPEVSSLGGDGPNIGYEFVIEESDNDTNPSDARHCTNWNRTLAADKSPYTVLNKVGFMRSENYRFGIIFINAKGISSFVKWIADIEMPTQREFPIVDDEGGKQRILGVKFEVNNIPLDESTGEPLSYRIVYVERTESNRSIVDQGLAIGKSTGATIGDDYPDGVTDYKDTSVDKVFYYSPNISFFRGSERSSYTNLKFNEVAKVRSKYSISENAYNGPWDDSNYMGWSWYSFSKLYTRTYTATPESKTISKSDYLKSGNDTSGFKTLYNWSSSNGAEPPRLFGTCTAVTLDSGFDNTTGNIFNVVKDGIVQYGGDTFSSRSNNIYIPAGNVITPTTTNSNVECFSGDTFITHWQLLKSMSNPAGTSDGVSFETANSAGFTNGSVVPLECTFKTELNTTTRLFDTGWLKQGFYVEDAGIYTFKAGDDADIVVTQLEDAYVYNSVNSRTNNTTNYIPKPFNYKEAVTDNMIRYSDENTPFNTDSNWSNWSVNNYQTVDKNLGAITSIHNWVNNILFMQPNGFGVCNVNERVTKIDDSGLATVLGAGDILGKPLYISTKNGSIHGDSVLMTNNSVSFYDRNDQGIILYQKSYTGNSSKNISKLNGINSFIRKQLSTSVNNSNKLLNYTNVSEQPLPKINSSLHLGVNAIASRDNMYYTFYDIIPLTGNIQYTNQQFVETIKFSQNMQKYNSFCDFNSPIYDNINGKISMLHPINRDSIWLLSDLNTSKGNYFDNDYDSVITISSNGANPLSKVFTNIQYTTDVTTEDGEDVKNETFSTMQFKNSHQTTDVVDIALKKNTKRRFRKWNVTIPRAIKKALEDRKDARFRDKYLECEFKFVNNLNKHFELKDMQASYIINQDEFRKLNKK